MAEDLREQLRERVKKMRIASGQKEFEKKHKKLKGRGGFLTHKDLKEVLTESGIRFQLRKDALGLNEDDTSSLVAAIQERGSKLYAILLWINESKCIKEILLDNNIDDVTLFTVKEEEETIPLSYCTQEALDQCPVFRKISNEFYKMQWIIPPTLPTKLDQEFEPERFIPPFEKAGERINGGGNGQIYRVKIAPGFLRIRDGQQAESTVYKRVKKEESKDWAKLLNEVRTLRERKHDNIVPLLSSFRAGREFPFKNGSDTTTYLYMIQPEASQSMEDWLRSRPENLLVGEVLESHIREIMYDLVSAVRYIHGMIGNYIAYHHDLKPSNILCFDRENQLPIWKICDFGSSNSKLAQGNTGTDNLANTYNYTPPEFWPKGKNGKIGRSWDIFSLGCIFLELATVYKYGWDLDTGLPKFQKQRRSNTMCPHGVEHTQRAKHEDDSFFNNMASVRSWLNHLRHDASDRLSRILDLIEEMLNEQPRERIFAWEVQIYFSKIKDADMNLASRQKLLDEICEEPKAGVNGLDKRNNPLRRGRSRKWDLPQSLLDILEKKGWKDATPTSTEERSSPVLVDHARTTLPGSRFWRPISAHKELDTQNITAYANARFYGRKELDEHLLQSFASGAKRVVLYGLWGMGKSHLAYHYAARLQDPHVDHADSKKHVFWVSARSSSIFLEHYSKIAAAMNLGYFPISPSRSVAPQVVKWLNENRGTWFLVIDGLDLVEVFDDIKDFLPHSDSGQVLFTTRNRKIFVEREILGVSRQHCHPVSPPDTKTAWLIFKNSFGDPSLQNLGASFNPILERLQSPLLISLAAKRMSQDEIACSDMCHDLKNDIVSCVKSLHSSFRSEENQAPTYMNLLLRPLLGPGAESKWRPELRLLCVLSCFDTSRLNFELIKWYHDPPQRHAMYAYIGLLRSCSFLYDVEGSSKSRESHTQIYKIPDLVRESILAWVRKTEGESNVWQRYKKMLRMLRSRFHESMKEHKAKLRGEEWPWLATNALQPHFEQFREYINSHRFKQLSNTSLGDDTATFLDDDTVQCIVTLSRAYSAEGKFGKARQVLDFAYKHYKMGKQRHTLSRVMLRARVDHCDQESTYVSEWEEAETICKELLVQSSNSDPVNREYKLRLDMARIYRLWGEARWREAAKQLSYLEGLGVQIDGYERPICPPSSKEQLSDTKWLCVLTEHARGQLALCTGEIEQAKSKLRLAKKATEEWFPKKREWIIGIDGLLAKATLEKGTEKELCVMEGILAHNVDLLKDRTPLRQQCATQMALAKVKMKLGSAPATQVVQTLKDLCSKVEKSYGIEDKRTQECRSQLKEATSHLESEIKTRRWWHIEAGVVTLSMIVFAFFVWL